MTEQQPDQTPDEPGTIRLMLTMGVAGLFAGLILVGIYLATYPRIQQNRYNDVQAAIQEVLPNVAETSTWVVNNGQLVAYDGPEGVLPEGEAVYSGYDSEGNLIGYAVPAEGAGFQDTIKLLYGYDPARGVIVGLAILENKETPGLGDRIVNDPEFHAGFEALEVAPGIVATKKGRSEPWEVDAISGATISSDAVVDILNESMSVWAERLADAEQEE